jgi:hypothetical protein
MLDPIRNFLDRDIPPLWTRLLEDFILPLLFLMWLGYMIGGGS